MIAIRAAKKDPYLYAFPNGLSRSYPLSPIASDSIFIHPQLQYNQ